MLTREIVSHVKVELRKGVSKEVIRNELSKKDLSEKEITHALHLAESLIEHEKTHNITHKHDDIIHSSKSEDEEKSVPLLISAIIIGYTIGQGFYFGVIHYSVLFSAFLSHALARSILINPFTPVVSASLFVFIAISIFYIVFTYIKNKWWWTVFQPSGVKIAFTFLTFFVMCLLFVVVKSGNLGLYSLDFIWLSLNVYFIPLSNPYWYAFNFIVYFLLLYPFAALLASFRETKILEKVLLIVLLLIFNPIVFNVGNRDVGMFNSVATFIRIIKTQYKCGILVTGVNPGYPADKAGMQAGTIITKIDNNLMTDVQQFTDYQKTVNSLKKVTLTTNKGTYTVTYTVLPYSPIYTLGIQYDQAYCSK